MKAGQAPAWRNPQARQLSWFCALLLLVIVAYANHWDNGFHFDDFHTIQNNPWIQSLKNIPRFFTDATTFSIIPANRTWRPVVSTSLAVDYFLAHGLSTRAFLASTFAWYLVQLWLMYALFLHLMEIARPGVRANQAAALFAVALYGVHPAMAETVNYIIQRGDVYSTLAVIAGLVIYATEPAWRERGIYLIPVALGLLSKPPAMVFPAILFVYLWLFEAMVPREALKRTIPSLALVALSAFLSKAMTPASFTPGALDRKGYWLTQPLVALRYFGSFFLPTHLSADSDFGMVRGFLQNYAWLGFLFIAGVVVAAWKCSAHARLRPIAFGLWWFLIALIPTSLFPLAEVENDHRMFFPFVGLALSVVWSLALLLEARKLPRLVPVSVCGAVLAGCCWGTWQRNEVWHSEESLWLDVTIKSPRNGRGLMNYGLGEMAVGHYDVALDYFTRAVPFTPDYPTLEINLGIVLGAMQRPAEAEPHFLRAIQLDSADAQCYWFYGRWLRDNGRPAEAIVNLRTAIAKNPSLLDPRHILMDLYAAQGDTPDLQALVNDTLAFAPGDAVAAGWLGKSLAAVTTPGGAPEALINQSLALYQAGKYQASIEAALKALQLRPNYADAWNNIMAGHNMLGQWDEAIAAGENAARLDPSSERIRNNLAWARSHQSKK